MEALTCLCDALVPSLQASSLHHDLNTDNRHQSSFESLGIGRRNVDDVNAFYKLSASEAGVPPIVAGMLTNVLKRKLMAISILLWLLSTAIGTFLLGGWVTMSKDFPYIRCYSQLESKQQEAVLQGWSLSSIPPFRAIFKLFKSIVLWAYYCKIDTNGDNPTWKAIGYCGPDPQVASANLLHSKQISHNQLGDHVINAKQAGECLKSRLSDAGCCMIKDLKGFTALVSKGSGRAAPNSNDIGIECDVVIVGSGSGGGVVAAVLAEKGYKVVVLDKGEYYAPDDISTLEGPSILSLYEKSGALATEDGGVSLAAARTVGGGSTVNWCVCFKTPENVRNEWVQDFGLQLFASEKYEQAMEAVWKRLSVQEVTNKHNLSNSILQNGCKRLGLNFGTLARNSSADHYCGWCSFGCPTGRKQSTPETWLLDAVKTNNTLILSNCEAQQILHSPNLTGKKPRQALGVMATMEDGTRVTRLFVKASATIVACGSLMTPPLLLNSGLENKNIGKNLHLHPGQSVWGIFPEGSGPEGTSYEGGIMTAYSRVSRRDSSSYGALLETLCLHPGIFAAFIPWCSGMDAKQRMLHYSRTVHICSVTRDKGSGSVRVDRNREPTFDYTLSDYDEETMMIGVDQALRVLVAAGATQIGTHQFDGECFCVQGANTADLEAYLARVRQRGAKKLRVTLASAHQLGSCRMGVDPQSSAVDPRGETWEVQGLFLGDGSVMPTSPGVNPMVTIQSIAYCIADAVAESLKLC
ncbi:unnamed protein product [Sphagnum balticum]